MYCRLPGLAEWLMFYQAHLVPVLHLSLWSHSQDSGHRSATVKNAAIGQIGY